MQIRWVEVSRPEAKSCPGSESLRHPRIQQAQSSASQSLWLLFLRGLCSVPRYHHCPCSSEQVSHPSACSSKGHYSWALSAASFNPQLSFPRPSPRMLISDLHPPSSGRLVSWVQAELTEDTRSFSHCPGRPTSQLQFPKWRIVETHLGVLRHL